MTITRTMIIYGSAIVLYRAACLVTRYSCCRRQFKNQKGSKLERKIIDYQTQQHVIAPNIANSIVLHLVSQKIEKLIQISNQEVKKNNFKMLDICHHYTSGLKAFSSDLMYRGVDELRLACGGIGFLNSSGIPEMWVDNSPLVTYEGVNVLMYQQSSRYALKQIKKSKQGKKLKFEFTYLNDIESMFGSRATVKTVEEASTMDFIERCLQIRSAF
jgi:acyl-CoA oxidase